MPAGRPALYTPELGKEICDLIANNPDFSLAAYCNQNGIPDDNTVLKWRDEYPEFKDWYYRAREIQALKLMDQTLSIADDGRNDWYERNGVRVVDNEVVNRSKLRVDTRLRIAQFLASKFLVNVSDSETGTLAPLVQIMVIGANGQPGKNLLDGKIDIADVIGKGKSRRLPVVAERKVDKQAKALAKAGKKGAK